MSLQPSQRRSQPANLPCRLPDPREGETLTNLEALGIHCLSFISADGQEWAECSCGDWAREWFPGVERQPTECGIVTERREYARRCGVLYIDMVERAILNGHREQLHLIELLARVARRG